MNFVFVWRRGYQSIVFAEAPDRADAVGDLVAEVELESAPLEVVQEIAIELPGLGGYQNVRRRVIRNSSVNPGLPGISTLGKRQHAPEHIVFVVIVMPQRGTNVHEC